MTAGEKSAGEVLRAARKKRAKWRLMQYAPTDGTEILVYWPIVKLDAAANLTDKPIGKGARVVTRWEAGGWAEPPFLEAVGDWFGDDCEYAREPSHWMKLPISPARSSVRKAIALAENGEGGRG